MHFSERLHILYFKFPDFHRYGLLGKAIDRGFGKIVKWVSDAWLPDYYSQTLYDFRLNEGKQQRDQEIICSLTSFPARIEKVWISIESLFRQSTAPDRIVLWLSKEQFPGMLVPKSLLQLAEKGLDIRFVEDDLKAHKKYLYALKEFPEDLVVTYDDDLYYDPYNLANVVEMAAQNHDTVCTNRAHKMKLSKSNELLPYRKWFHNVVDQEASFALFATGGYGTLYSNGILFNDFDNVAVFKSNSFQADDIWLKAMSFLNNSKVKTNDSYGKDPIPIGKSQEIKLVSTNVITGGNDNQLNNLITHYQILIKDFFE